MNNNKIKFWNCNSMNLANFLMGKGIQPVKRGIYADTGKNWWAFLYAEIQPFLQEWADTKPTTT